MFRLDGGVGTVSSTSSSRLRSRSRDGARRESRAPACEPVERFVFGFGSAFVPDLALARFVEDFGRAARFETARVGARFFAALGFTRTDFFAFFRFGAADLFAGFLAFLAFFAIGTPPLTL
jgi:hypothetical protein